jgi:RNA polymerase sigma factor (sigma-70 family)
LLFTRLNAKHLQEKVIKIQVGEALLKRCREGEELAFRELYYRYNKAMFNICMRMLNNTGEAEDVLQESFIQAFRRIGELKDENAFGGWLRKIVVNRCIDQVRKRKPWSLLAVDDIADELPYEEPVTYEPQVVQKAIAMLPEGYRLIVTLFLFEDYTHKQIAEKLGISEGTSKSQYARGRQKLATLIRQLSNDRQA